MKARLRFIGLLSEVNLDPSQSLEGKWLLKLFDRVAPDYVAGKCRGGHDMNTHVLLMLIQAIDMLKLLGDRLGCGIAHLLALILVHNLDRISELEDDDWKAQEANVNARFWKDMFDCPFDKSDIESIFEAFDHHSEPYDQDKGSQLQRRLQELDMISRLNVLTPMVVMAHFRGNIELADLDQPWLLDIPVEKRFGRLTNSAYTHMIGTVLKWYDWLPEDVRPLINRRQFNALLLYIKTFGEMTAYIQGGKDCTELDLRLALPEGFQLP